jgi:hypothetical protein
MTIRFIKRPSGSMVVAIIALVVAASGTAIASSAVGGNALIKKGSLSGNRLQPNSITGKQVKESTLGQVPKANLSNLATSATKATTATNATNAGNAATVGGHTVITFEKLVATNTTTAQTVFTLGGLTLSLACDSGGQPTLTGTGTTTGSLLRGVKVTGAATPASQFGTSQITAGTPVSIMLPTDKLGGFTLQYATPSGSVVSVNGYVDDFNTLNNFNGCSASGSAIS